jgi:uncharacterized membrane protein YoaK (UPF0700 family)
VLLALTVVTGLVDAVSILVLGRVFVANMTGNVVFAGFAIAGAPGFSLSSSLFAVAGFLAGALLGGRLAGRLGTDRALHLRAAMAAELAFVAVALVVMAASGAPVAGTGLAHLGAGQAGGFGAVSRDALALLLAVAMGIQNSVAVKLAVPDLTTTVLTRTLTGIGADSRAGRRGHVLLARRVLAVAVMIGGAILGAFLVLQVASTAALAVAAGLLLAAVATALRAARVPGPWRSAASAGTSSADPGSA